MAKTVCTYPTPPLSFRVSDELAFQWIQIFNKSTKKTMKGKYRLLICDGFGSHATHEFVSFCEKNNIILFFLPSHTSHYLQPLDVGVFHAYKHWHAEAVADATYTGGGKFTQVEILAALSGIRKKTFKKRTIEHGFRQTGIVPFNPAVVLDTLPEIAEEQPTTPSDSGSFASFGSTPKTAKRFEQWANNLPHAEGHGYSIGEVLNTFIKGSIAQAHLAETLQRELNNYTVAERARRE
jgi:hypothetical protein